MVFFLSSYDGFPASDLGLYRPFLGKIILNLGHSLFNWTHFCRDMACSHIPYMNGMGCHQPARSFLKPRPKIWLEQDVIKTSKQLSASPNHRCSDHIGAVRPHDLATSGDFTYAQYSKPLPVYDYRGLYNLLGIIKGDAGSKHWSHMVDM